MPLTPSGRRPSGKASEVMAILEQRIRGGDYLVAPLPSGRELAAELGVSYVTARKAIGALQAQGLLTRGGNGRLVLGGRRAGGQLAQLAFIAPNFPSLAVMRWRLAIDRLADEHPCAVKNHFFRHWHDPALIDIIERSDGAFLYPTAEELPAAFAARLRARRIVVIDQDWSALGVPSICCFPAAFVRTLLDHCRARAHLRIACLNTQPHDYAIQARLAAYQGWAVDHGMVPHLIDAPVIVGEDPAVRAQAVMAEVLRGGARDWSALFCTTGTVALAAMRALHLAGIAPGREVAVCTLNDDGLGELVIPSLTAQAQVDPTPFLRQTLSWILDPQRAWQGSALIQPERCEVAVRESTGAG